MPARQETDDQQDERGALREREEKEHAERYGAPSSRDVRLVARKVERREAHRHRVARGLRLLAVPLQTGLVAAEPI